MSRHPLPRGSSSPLIPHSTSLVDFIISSPSPSDLSNSLSEFAWRCLNDGVSVRLYCGEVSKVIARLPLDMSTTMKDVLGKPPLLVLFPLVTFPDPYLKDAAQSDPMSSSIGLPLSRKQLIDVMTKLSWHSKSGRGSDDSLRAIIWEVCLEYVGQKWRVRKPQNPLDAVDHIARKLTEIVFEIHVDGEPTITRTLILPIIHAFRFALGLFPVNQLVSRLDNISTHPTSAGLELNAAEISQAWLMARLRAGADPLLLVENLRAVQERLGDKANNTTLTAVLLSFGLCTPPETGEGGTSYEVHNLAAPSTPQTGRAASKSFSDLTHTPTKNKPSPQPRSPSFRKFASFATPSPHKWWSHRRTHSSSSRLATFTPFFNADRRPSLPLLSSTSPFAPYEQSPQVTSRPFPSLFALPRSPLGGTSPTGGESTKFGDLLALAQSCRSAEEIGIVMFHHLFKMRHKIPERRVDDWFLGQGKVRASILLSNLEDQLSGYRDLAELTSTFANLRSLFDIHPKVLTRPLQVRAQCESVDDQPPLQSPISARMSAMWFRLRRSLTAPELESLSSFGFTDRGSSFDLDQYLEEVSPEGSARQSFASQQAPCDNLAIGKAVMKRRSTGEMSSATAMTGMTNLTGLSILQEPPNGTVCGSTHRASVVSSFTIREAVFGYPFGELGPPTDVPRRTKSDMDLVHGVAQDDSGNLDLSRAEATRVWVQTKRGSISEPNLLDIVQSREISDSASDEDDELASRPKTLGSLRRVSRIRGRLHGQVSALDLGLVHALPRSQEGLRKQTPLTPPKVPSVPPVPPVGACSHVANSGDRDRSAVSFSSAHEAQVQQHHTVTIPKNMGGFDTPPATPPLVNSATITFTLSEMPSSSDHTTTAKGGQDVNREWAIVDGEHVSRPRLDTCLPSGLGRSEAEAPISTIPHVKRRLRRLEDPRPPHVSPGSRSPVRVSLKRIVGLFDTSGGEVIPKNGLREWEVQEVLRDIVESSMNEHVKDWLLVQMKELLEPNYNTLIDAHLAIMEPHETPPHRRCAKRNRTYPPIGSSSYTTLTPMPSSPTSRASALSSLSLFPPRSRETRGETKAETACSARLRISHEHSDDSTSSCGSERTFGSP